MNLPALSFLNQADNQLLSTPFRLIESLALSLSLCLSISHKSRQALLPSSLYHRQALFVVLWCQEKPTHSIIANRHQAFLCHLPPSIPLLFSPCSIERTLLCKLYHSSPHSVFSHPLALFSSFQLLFGASLLWRIQPRPNRTPFIMSSHVYVCVCVCLYMCVCVFQMLLYF